METINTPETPNEDKILDGNLENQEGLKVTTAPPTQKKPTRVLLEILVYGREKDKKRIKNLVDALRAQMDKTRKGKKARLFTFIDKGENSFEEIRQGLIENACCKYYVFANTETSYAIDTSFVVDCLKRIKILEDAVSSVKTKGICVSKNDYTQQEIVEEKTEETIEHNGPYEEVIKSETKTE